MNGSQGNVILAAPGNFTRTHWTEVLAARSDDSTEACRALEALCNTYWYPLYAFVRRKGHSPHDAEDLVQGFFQKLIERRSLRHVDQSKGRFRTFLLTSMTNFLVNEASKARALKRGGDCWFESLDGLSAEEGYIREPQDCRTPEALYERCWAMLLLESSLNKLRQHYYKKGKGELFEYIKDWLTPGGNSLSHAELGLRLGKSEHAVTNDIQRLRRHYRECLREEIARTVGGPEQVDSEIEELRRVLSRG